MPDANKVSERRTLAISLRTVSFGAALEEEGRERQLRFERTLVVVIILGLYLMLQCWRWSRPEPSPLRASPSAVPPPEPEPVAQAEIVPYPNR